MDQRRLFDILCEVLGVTPEELRSLQQRVSHGPAPETAPETAPEIIPADDSPPPAASDQASPEARQVEGSPAPSRIQWDIAPLSVASEQKAPRPEKPAQPAGIEWAGGRKTALPDPASLVDVEDAFDHTPLMPGEKVAFCKIDRVAYHMNTWDFLRSENQGKCCICRRANVFVFITLPGQAVPPAMKPLAPAISILRPGDQIIHLKDVPEYVNMAVVVQDFVYEVYRTKSTGTHFIRFEPRRVNEPVFGGFKVVIFPKYENSWAQAGLSIKDYQGHIIRVRGVIQVHPEWGIELLVNSPRVIQIADDLAGKTDGEADSSPT